MFFYTGKGSAVKGDQPATLLCPIAGCDEAFGDPGYILGRDGVGKLSLVTKYAPVRTP